MNSNPTDNTPNTAPTRLDLLVMRQTGFSREYSQEVIAKGFVSHNGKPLTKPGAKLAPDTALVVTADKMKYVSRGGYKLEKAVEVFGISVHNNTCIDIGASTGGFTDCLLQAGARKVYAIDTGTNQLADALRGDPRVVAMENTNIREIAPADIGEAADCITIDVSFISLEKILPHAAALLADGGVMIALVKPQFEAGRAHLNCSGVVSDPKVRLSVLNSIYTALPTHGLSAHGCIASPISGQNGNMEFLLALHKHNSTNSGMTADAFRQAAKTAVSTKPSS